MALQKNSAMYTIRVPFSVATDIQVRAKERGEKPVQTIRNLIQIGLFAEALRADIANQTELIIKSIKEARS